MEKFYLVLNAVLGVMGAVSALCGVLAAVLPDGKFKTACSYVGMRLGKALEAAKGGAK